MTQPLWAFPAHLPRHAFSSRDAPRAADIWRAFQEVAVEASTRAGWSPARFRETGTAFVVRSMTVRHHLEPFYGEPLDATTWVCRFRRQIFSSREVRLSSARGLVAEGTQEWVHVGAELKPSPASDAVAAAFPEHPGGGPIALPDYEELPGEEHVFAFQAWYTAMDPLGHANHPAYVDYCDEATSRVMVGAGLEPVVLRPVAETVTFRTAVNAGEHVEVRTRRVGCTADGAVVLRHRVRGANDLRYADATTIRTLAGIEAGALLRAFD